MAFLSITAPAPREAEAFEPTLSPTTFQCSEVITNSPLFNDASLVVSLVCVILSTLVVIAFVPEIKRQMEFDRSGKARVLSTKPPYQITTGLLVSCVIISWSGLTSAIRFVATDEGVLEIYKTTQNSCALIFMSSAVAFRLWSINIFWHTLWSMELPRREGELRELVAQAREELDTRIMHTVSVTVGFSVLDLVLGAALEASNRLFFLHIAALILLCTVLDGIMVKNFVVVARSLREDGVVLQAQLHRFFLGSAGVFLPVATFWVVIALSVAHHKSNWDYITSNHNNHRQFYEQCTGSFVDHVRLLVLT